MKKIIILLALVTIILADYQYYNPNIPWNTQYKDQPKKEPNKRIPFPQCLLPGSKSKRLETSFNRQLQKGMEDLFNPNNDDMDSSGTQLRKNEPKSVVAAAAAIKLTRDIMTILACDLNGTDTANLNKFLNKFSMPQQFCSYREKPSCDQKRKFRLSDGVCNNDDFPYHGSSQTAFGRILDADYEDHLAAPRRTSKNGELLPSCREISLELGSKPVYNRNLNHLFAMFGQFIANDMSIATPAIETAASKGSPCTCNSKENWEKCNVIEVQADDPYLSGQNCMVFPATAQAFKDQVCTFGVKEQMNGNTHFLDLSTVYGSSLPTALALRADKGQLKSATRYWLKHELPPNQRQPKSCSDATSKRPCFASGDSRLMDNLLLTGINTMFLRFHNQVAKKVAENLGDVSTHRIYEISKQFTTDLFQSIVLGYWAPKLLGPEYSETLLTSLTTTGYNKSVTPVVYNEVATAALNLHSLVRDEFSRCSSKAKFIDVVSYLNISHKAKYAYDIENNGIDSILCGSLYDYGMAFDGNFATQLHHRLYESTNKYGHVWRNDIVAIDICRGREHGIRGYNAYRKHCNFSRAKSFADFRDTISVDGIKRLRNIYEHPDDVDLFVGLNLEEPLQGGVVGPVSACLLAEQFRVLCEGDRFCITHRHGLSKDELQKLSWIGLAYLTCKTVDIEQIPLFPFRAPSETNNPLINCSIFGEMDNDFISKVISLAEKPISATNKLTANLFNVTLEQFLLKPGFYDYRATY